MHSLTGLLAIRSLLQTTIHRSVREQRSVIHSRARACTSWNKPQNAGNLVLVVSNNTIMIHDNSRRSVISVLLKFLYHSNVIFNEWIFIPWFPHYNRHRKEQCPCLKLLYVTCVHQNVRCILFCDKVIFKICKR